MTALIVTFCFILPIIFFAGCGKSLKLTLSTEDGELAVKPGESTQLVVTLSNAGKNDNVANVVYSITSGSGFAAVDADGLLSINANATVGNKVKIVAKLGTTKSNILEITVDRIPVESITLSSNKTNILPSGFATITVATNPVNTTDLVECQITQGADVADLIGNKVFVDDSAAIGTVIKVQAFSGTINSNELEFTVAAATPETLYISMLDEITVDIHGVTSNVLSAIVKDETFENVAGQPVEFEIKDGEEYISILTSGYNCEINVIGHGEAVIRATLENGNFAETFVNAIKPPTDLDVLDVFSQRQNINYTVGNTEELDYSVKIHETNVCQEIEYTFEKKEGSSYVRESFEGEFATYNKETQKIDFNTTGVIRVNAKSNSGSRIEATVSQEFTVNDGINVNDFAELREALHEKTNPGIVNIVVLEDPNDSDGNNYEIVPQQGSGAVANWGIIRTSGNVTVNGNNHRINLSDLDRRVEVFPGTPDFICIAPNGAQPYTVELNNIQIIGSINSPTDNYDYLKDGTTPNFYFYNRAIKIGEQKSTNYAFDDQAQTNIVAPCYLTMNNINISKVVTGMRICHAVNAKISNTRVADCWSNGIETVASIITLENMTYGLCGAAGMEVTPEFSDKAGVNFNQNQSVTFSGYIESTNINNGNTGHLLAFAAAYGLGTIAPLLLGICEQLTESQISNFLRETSGVYEFQFVALVFNGDSGANSSDFHAGSATNSIAHISETATNAPDTTHQYLLIDLPNNLGRILVKNWNYQA